MRLFNENALIAVLLPATKRERSLLNRGNLRIRGHFLLAVKHVFLLVLHLLVARAQVAEVDVADARGAVGQAEAAPSRPLQVPCPVP